MRSLISIALILAMTVTALGEIREKVVEYNHGDVVLEGFLAYDGGTDTPRPGILVVHEWTGVNDYAKSRCRQLAEMGYIAFAVDMYGKGVRPKNFQEAAKQSSIYKKDRPLMRDRVNAGLEILTSDPMCDRSSIAAIGYCFGGTTVPELARSGAEIDGVVSFHGTLDTPDPSIAENIRCKVMVCHGAVDPYVPAEQLDGFISEMEGAQVDYQYIAYSGAVHAFTNPESGDDPSRGAAYDANADKRSWQHMKMFFDEIFH